MKTPETMQQKPQTPETKSPNVVHDFGWARGDSGLRAMLQAVDANGFELVCVTHVSADSYRVFFRRPAV